MKSCTYWKLAVAAATLLSATAVMAQPGGGRGFGRGFGRGGGMDPSMLLLGQEPVQKELALSDDQKTQVTKLSDDSRQAMRDLFQSQPSPEEMQTKMQDMAKESKKKVADILLPPQVERLDQIALQFAMANGPAAALSRDDLASKLGLTDDQKKQLTEVSDDARAKVQELFANGPPADDQERQDRQKKMTEINTAQKDKVMAMLTADQKTKLESLEGKAFDTSTIQMFGGRGGRRGGGPGGPGA